MSHYSIYLNNQNEETNTYGFFAAPPESEDVGTEVYSNVWISHKLAQDQRFKVDIDKNYYACECIHNLKSCRAWLTSAD